MSYFMTLAGPPIDLSDLPPIELIAADQAQYYIRDWAPKLVLEDGLPIFLVEDGETGTSHNFLVQAQHQVWATNSLEGSLLGALLERFCHRPYCWRIWWASDEANPLDCPTCHSLEEVRSVVVQQVNAGQDIYLRYGSRPSLGE